MDTFAGPKCAYVPIRFLAVAQEETSLGAFPMKKSMLKLVFNGNRSTITMMDHCLSRLLTLMLRAISSVTWPKESATLADLCLNLLAMRLTVVFEVGLYCELIVLRTFAANSDSLISQSGSSG